MTIGVNTVKFICVTVILGQNNKVFNSHLIMNYDPVWVKMK